MLEFFNKIWNICRLEERWIVPRVKAPPTSALTSSSPCPGDSSPRSTSPPSLTSRRTSSGTCRARWPSRRSSPRWSPSQHLKKKQSRWPQLSLCQVTPPSFPRRRYWDRDTKWEWSQSPKSIMSGKEKQEVSSFMVMRTRCMFQTIPILSPVVGGVIWCRLDAERKILF